MSRTKIRETDDKKKLVREWDESGLSAEEFGRRRGIRGRTLQAWGRAIRGRLRERRKAKVGGQSFEVVEVKRRDEERRVEIVLPSGHRLVLAGDWSARAIAEVAAELEARR